MNQIIFGSHLKTLFLMSAAKSRGIWFLTENCKPKCSLSFYAKQFRLVFPKLIYTIPDEQYCELKHFEKFSWNAKFFQILNLNLLAEKKRKKSTSSLSFNFWAKNFWSTFSKLYRTSQGCYRGKMENNSKMFFPKLTFTRRVDFLGIQFDLKYFIYDDIVGF